MGVAQVEDRNTRQCALTGCAEWVEDIPGRPTRRYCCAAHRIAARQARRARTRRERGSRLEESLPWLAGESGSPDAVDAGGAGEYPLPWTPPDAEAPGTDDDEGRAGSPAVGSDAVPPAEPAPRHDAGTCSGSGTAAGDPGPRAPTGSGPRHAVDGSVDLHRPVGHGSRRPDSAPAGWGDAGSRRPTEPMPRHRAPGPVAPETHPGLGPMASAEAHPVPGDRPVESGPAGGDPDHRTATRPGDPAWAPERAAGPGYGTGPRTGARHAAAPDRPQPRSGRPVDPGPRQGFGTGDRPVVDPRGSLPPNRGAGRRPWTPGPGSAPWPADPRRRDGAVEQGGFGASGTGPRPVTPPSGYPGADHRPTDAPYGAAASPGWTSAGGGPRPMAEPGGNSGVCGPAGSPGPAYAGGGPRPVVEPNGNIGSGGAAGTSGPAHVGPRPVGEPGGGSGSYGAVGSSGPAGYDGGGPRPVGEPGGSSGSYGAARSSGPGYGAGGPRSAGGLGGDPRPVGEPGGHSGACGPAGSPGPAPAGPRPAGGSDGGRWAVGEPGVNPGSHPAVPPSGGPQIAGSAGAYPSGPGFRRRDAGSPADRGTGAGQAVPQQDGSRWQWFGGPAARCSPDPGHGSCGIAPPSWGAKRGTHSGRRPTGRPGAPGPVEQEAAPAGPPPADPGRGPVPGWHPGAGPGPTRPVPPPAGGGGPREPFGVRARVRLGRLRSTGPIMLPGLQLAPAGSYAPARGTADDSSPAASGPAGTPSRHRRPRPARPLSPQRRTMAVLGIAGVLAGGYAFTGTQPPAQMAMETTAMSPAFTGDAEWAARAQIALASVTDQLADLVAAEDAWGNTAAARAGDAPPAEIADLRDRRALLEVRQATLQSQLDNYAALGRVQQDLRATEERLRAVEQAIAEAPAKPGTREDAVALVALRDQREERQRQLAAGQDELARLQDNVREAIRTPLPDDGEVSDRIRNDALDLVAALGGPLPGDTGAAAGVPQPDADRSGEDPTDAIDLPAGSVPAAYRTPAVDPAGLTRLAGHDQASINGAWDGPGARWA